ncbi:N-acetyltransferase [Sphingobium sp. GW456-12-10-14-TSB1]|uniref:N-acetyltransferase n=1 Tax=Sphingobium xenophagum TaxID=121428 RepID=A0A249MR05_SPHXE|nr:MULTISPECIES: GNAT family N-acetyltransferase [Sphingobium]ASY43780.1 N-acetyltransferase [Sphingobium xenophagum]OUC55761.1 N-acetyltransferase [Sphingobium sp. GW456-12-10-14-TSB1]QWT13074.1 GNAT family N-acetyltransferase [Sphingobium xenophagum]
MTDVVARIAAGVAELPRAQWDACAGADNPFVSWDFLSALERSGSVGEGTGWQPLPLMIDGADGRIAAAAPLYAKSHSQGEYVFDHGWADAWERAGGRYYPKIQIAAPFSPVPGPRLLLRDRSLAPALIAGIETLVERNHLSSAHATFVAPDQVGDFEAAGWLIREDSQFHWSNRGYGSFDDFLADLSSAKRKNIRKERARAVEGLDIVHLTGPDLTEAHWDIFWDFYQDTGSRKWGTPYLTRSFFSLLGETMADRVLLMLALRDGRAVAGALNLIGADTLYGRYWGCNEEVPNLHFELCYYQAIDVAIARGLARVEAGAQGGHKLARGYAPEPTFSAHYIPDAGFRRAVADFLTAERAGVQQDRLWLAGRTPFRKAD